TRSRGRPRVTRSSGTSPTTRCSDCGRVRGTRRSAGPARAVRPCRRCASLGTPPLDSCLVRCQGRVGPRRPECTRSSHGIRTHPVHQRPGDPADHPRGRRGAGTGGAELPDERYCRTLDPWVSLAAVASVTTTIRLGTAVAIPVESDPITLAKTIASVDHLSDGRAVLGVGYGWNLDEMADHGVP